MSNQDAVFEQVRDALKHLYDYPYLEEHPLALRYWPQIRSRGPSRAQRLSRLLLQSIEELNPPSEPSQVPSRVRAYLLLAWRFVEERPVPDVMRELGVSRRQFFREQQKAIVMLAAVLREKLSQQVVSSDEPGDLLGAEARRILTHRETIDPAETARGVLEVVSHLATQHGVALEYDLAQPLPPIIGNRTILRQVFLNVLSSLISQPGTQRVRLQVHSEEQRVIVKLVAKPVLLERWPDDALGRCESDLIPVRRLVEMMGGRWLEFESVPNHCTCRFDFPVDSQKVLLVIEDNVAVIRAFRRYLASHNYQVVGATTGDEALQLAHKINPTAITLDILMPNQDGWEILQVLKKDPVTQHIPVIICSVLEDPELARSLGATVYLPKPVAQADLLSALNGLSVFTS
jgi:CheY-like chemotaxis protein